MASELERWISHIDLHLHAKGKPKDLLSLTDALTFLEAQGVAGTSKATVQDERWIIQLCDLKIDSRHKFATVLFLGIDRERAEAVYGNIKTLNLRTAPKLPEEGGAVSAHLVISTVPDAGSGRHRAVLEDVEGLSRSRLVPFLRSQIRDNIKFVEKLPNGDPKDSEPYLVSEVFMGKNIADQLNDARLLAVDLIKESPFSQIDKSVEYHETTRYIQFRPNGKASGQRARAILSSILARTDSQDYPEVRIRLEEPEGLQRTVSVNRHKQNALASAFQLRTLINDLNPPLGEASKTVVTHLAARMAEALSKR